MSELIRNAVSLWVRRAPEAMRYCAVIAPALMTLIR